MNKSDHTSRTNIPDQAFRLLSMAGAISIIVIMLAIATVLLVNSLPSIREFGWRFLWDNTWNPVAGEFGAASTIYGTLVSTAIAMLIAAPMGVIIALFLVELSHPILAKFVGGAIELLAAIPSIIYGMWGLFVFVPIMQTVVEPWLSRNFGAWPIFNVLFSGPPIGIGMLTAGIILALMILPFITAVSRDVLRMVPPVLKEAGHGAGATMWEVTRQISLPYGIRGIVGAMFIGLGRAIGETMAVTFVIGNSHDISASLFAGGNSIASSIALEFGEAMNDPMFMSVLIELGLILFAITFIFQIIAQLWINKLSKHES